MVNVVTIAGSSGGSEAQADRLRANVMLHLSDRTFTMAVSWWWQRKHCWGYYYC